MNFDYQKHPSEPEFRVKIDVKQLGLSTGRVVIVRKG